MQHVLPQIRCTTTRKTQLLFVFELNKHSTVLILMHKSVQNQPIQVNNQVVGNNSINNNNSSNFVLKKWTTTLPIVRHPAVQEHTIYMVWVTTMFFHIWGMKKQNVCYRNNVKYRTKMIWID